MTNSPASCARCAEPGPSASLKTSRLTLRRDRDRVAQLMMVGTVGERLAGGSKDFVVVEATDELVRTGKPLAHGEVDLAVAGGRSPRDDGVADPVVVGGDHVGGHLNLPQSTSPSARP